MKKVISMREYTIRSAIFKIIYIISLFFASEAFSQSGDNSGFYMPSPQQMKFEVGINATKKIYVNRPELYPQFTSREPLPQGITLSSDGKISWMPSENEKLATYTLKIKAYIASSPTPGDGYEYWADIIVSSIPKKDDPYGGVYDAKIECDKTTAAYREIGATDSVANQIALWESFFQTFMNNNSTSAGNTSNGGLSNAEIIRNVLTNPPKRPFGNFTVSQGVLNALTLLNLYAPQIKIPTRPQYMPSPPSVEDMSEGMSKHGSHMISSIGTVMYDVSANLRRGGTNYHLLDQINSYLNTVLDEIKNPRGVNQADLLFVYLLSLDETKSFGLFRIATDFNLDANRLTQYEENIKNKARNIFIAKVTPSVECNNLAGDLKLIPLSWEQLGMNTYQHPGEWFPWVSPLVTQGVGRVIHEYPIAYDLAKLVPVFGTSLAILDGALTVYMGDDVHGNKIGTAEATASLAFDLVSASFGAAAVLKNVNEFQAIAARVKAFKNLPKNADNIVDGLQEASDLVKRELKYADEGVADLTPCLPVAARLRDDANMFGSDKSDTRGLFETVGVCAVRTYGAFKRSPDKFSHSVRAFADTNLVKNVGKWKLAYKNSGQNIVNAFNSLTGTISDKSHLLISALSYEEVAVKIGRKKIYITGTNKTELEHIPQGSSQPLIGTEELRVLKNSDTDISVISSSIIDRSLDSEKVVNSPYPTLYNSLLNLMKRARYGVETGHDLTNLNDRGDHVVITKILTTYRKKFGDSDPTEIPVVIFTDQKAAIDAYELGSGKRILPKNFYSLSREDQQKIIRPLYEKLLVSGSKKLMEGKIPVFRITNANLKNLGLIGQDDLTDFSNIPFHAVFLPLNCRHSRIQEVIDAYPSMTSRASKIPELKDDF